MIRRQRAIIAAVISFAATSATAFIFAAMLQVQQPRVHVLQGGRR